MIILSHSYHELPAAAEAEVVRLVLPQFRHRQRLSRTCRVRCAGLWCIAHLQKAMHERHLVKGVRPKPEEAKGVRLIPWIDRTSIEKLGLSGYQRAEHMPQRIV